MHRSILRRCRLQKPSALASRQYQTLFLSVSEVAFLQLSKSIEIHVLMPDAKQTAEWKLGCSVLPVDLHLKGGPAGLCTSCHFMVQKTFCQMKDTIRRENYPHKKPYRLSASFLKISKAFLLLKYSII